MKGLVILFVLTSNAILGDTGQPTGVWLEEFTTPYYLFRDAGYQVEVVSIKGGAVPVDPRSLEEPEALPASVQRYLKDEEARRLLTESAALASVNTAHYAVIFLPGGHGTMWDLPGDAVLADAVSKALADNRIVAAVCHGPAGLLDAKDERGKPVVSGRRVAAFTNSEEEAVGLTDAVPFLLEDRLTAQGAILIREQDFRPIAVADRNLITGQNPASSELVANLVLDTLKKGTILPPALHSMPKRKASPTLPRWVPVADE